MRAHLFAYRLVATLEGPPVFAVVPITLLAKFEVAAAASDCKDTVRRPKMLELETFFLKKFQGVGATAANCSSCLQYEIT